MGFTDTLSDVLEDVDILPYEENDDPNAKAHYINPPGNTHIWEPGMTAADVVALARLSETEIVALCGHRFTPKHDPQGLTVCSRCVDIAANIVLSDG